MEDKYYRTDAGEIIDTSTGEMVALKDIEKAISKNFYNSFIKVNDDLRGIGSNTKFTLVASKDNQMHQCVKVKERFLFNKVFRVEVRNMIEKSKLSIYALAFISKFEPYLYFPTNSLVIDGKRPTIEELWTMLGVKKTKMYEILKELEKADVIRKLDLNGNSVIYFNPFLYSCGGLVDKDTFKLFEDSIYNPLNKEIEN